MDLKKVKILICDDTPNTIDILENRLFLLGIPRENIYRSETLNGTKRKVKKILKLNFEHFICISDLFFETEWGGIDILRELCGSWLSEDKKNKFQCYLFSVYSESNEKSYYVVNNKVEPLKMKLTELEENCKNYKGFFNKSIEFEDLTTKILENIV